MSPTVSVLMPVYNAERYVAAAVESILAQTFTDFEFLIVDDGSTDRSLAILQRYAARDPRIQLVSRPNTGYVVALNEMLARARGEFLARMDADDISMPERFAVQVSYLQKHPNCVAVGSQALAIDSDGDPIALWTAPTDHQMIAAQHLRGHSQIHHPAVMLRSEAVLAVGGYRVAYQYAEDYDLYMRLEDRGRLANLPQVLLKFRRHADSVMHSRAHEQAERLRRLLQETYERRGLTDPLPDLSGMDLIRRPADYHRSWAWGALGAGNLATARKHTLATLRRNPFAPETWRLVYCVLRGH